MREQKTKEGGSSKVASDVKSRRSPLLHSLTWIKHRGCQRASSRSSATKQDGATHKPGVKPKHVAFPPIKEVSKECIKSTLFFTDRISLHLLPVPTRPGTLRPAPGPVFGFCAVDRRMFGKEWKVKVLVAQSCLTVCDLMDCSPPGCSVHGISQPRILG